ncbi:ABC-F family ATP-binding cassette domain-containing protein [Paracidobacterium acidisoli]|uniref:ABC transporter ATP-binding protein n=1 Tax=Paracidobacterium acidisoli TaxID=2303751 RepID=A0A372ITW1_9BACT|nr:ABC-F family ATP-binding cassette domain-containing protein [Paracidobacterium acidisoli]MBT9330801.1 ABC-F family ATP-binding cassette domain-containing protein [Paracidobacterium acidisoli]
MLILNAQNLTKAFGAAPLFRDISFTVNEGDHIGLIGPNGSGKSTLLKMMAGEIPPDEGAVTLRSGARMVYIEQDSQFAPGETVRSVVEEGLRRARVAEAYRESRLRITLGKAGLIEFDTEAVTLSGGWKKRLAIAQGLVQQPDLLLLDEPTNHLDLAGIEWLEELIRQSGFACVIVSHDRYFLENFATGMAELDRAYPSGMLRTAGTYSTFLERKEEFLEAQAKRQEALENRVKVEMEWLRRGPKARTTKSKARIDKANELIGDLAAMQSRGRTATAGIDFTATERQTKRLVELEGVGYSAGGRALFSNLNFAVTAGMRLGLVGANGSGKTTLLRLIAGELEPEEGTIRRANLLRVTYFEQNRRLDGNQTLRRALAPDSDAIVYQDRVIHVASWASRFLFTGEQLNQPVERLSGGERARVLIARLMLQPADLLILDEPTNDLDIPTLEILEESLLEYPGSVLLVTHDRYMLDRVANVVLGLDGRGEAAAFADYSQWETWQAEQASAAKKSLRAENDRSTVTNSGGAAAQTAKKKLSYLEAREWAAIEERIAEAEDILRGKRALLEDSAVVTDAAKLQTALAEAEAAQQAVDTLFARWAELEAKQS